jgi:hypothetical protein
MVGKPAVNNISPPSEPIPYYSVVGCHGLHQNLPRGVS